MADKTPTLSVALNKEFAYKDYLTRIDALANGEKNYAKSFPNRKITFDRQPEVNMTNVQFGKFLVKLRKDGKIDTINKLFDSEWNQFQPELINNKEILETTVKIYGNEILNLVKSYTKSNWTDDEIQIYPSISIGISRHKDAEIFIAIDYGTEELLIPDLIHELIHANTRLTKESLGLKFKNPSDEMADDYLSIAIVAELEKKYGLKLKYQFNEAFQKPFIKTGDFQKIRDMCTVSIDYIRLVKEIDKLITEKYAKD